MKHRSETHLASLVTVVTMALAGCGGASSSDPPDTTAPTVSSTSPAASGTGVDTAATVTATFSEAVSTSTVNATSFTLRDSLGSVNGTVTLNSASKVATFTHAALGLARQHTATLTNTIADSAGNLLASNYSWQFTTRDGSWKTAQTIEVEAGDAASAQVAFDASGNALAVWSQNDGSWYSIWASRYVVGTGWGTPQKIDGTETDDAESAQLAVAAGGNAVVVWTQNQDGRLDIWANRYTVGTGWGTAELIETNDDGSANFPQVVVDAGGNALAAWPHYAGSARYDLWAARYVVGTGWSAPQLIETSAGHATNVEMTIDGSGNVIAAWSQPDGNTNSIWANRYSVGTGWGTAELIETANAGAAAGVHLAADAGGNALAVWAQSNGAQYSIWANRYTAGIGWGTAALIETDDAGYVGAPHIAMDSGGNALAAWPQSDGTKVSMRANRYVAGTGWGAAALIESGNTGGPDYPDIAVDQLGNAVAVWTETDGTYDSIWANRYVAGTGWGAAQLVESEPGPASRPSVAIDSSGRALVAWQLSDGSRRSIWANRFE